jgi:fatty-acyl-CoA synthase/long-chain acyl-CoA synthetase
MLNTGMTIAVALRQVAEARLDQEALVCGEVRVTYGQLLERVGALARGLQGLGVRKADKVAALLPPGAEFVYLLFAVAELGGVIVPLNPQLRQRALSDVLRDAEPVALITSRPVEDAVLHSVSSLRHVIFAVAKSAQSLVRDTRCDGRPASAGSSRLKPGLRQDCAPETSLSLAGLMAAPEAPQSPDPVSPQDLLALLYTSGTTGTPKGTMHSHRSLIAPVVASIKLRELWVRRPSLKTLGQTARALARYRERLLRAAGRPQTFLSTVGWHTITGLEVVFQALLMGDRLVVMPRFHPHQAMELIEQERVTVVVAVPMAYQVMLGLQDFDRFDTSSLLICGTGAAPCPPHLAREIQRRFGCAVHIGFGATETAGGIAATSLADSTQRQSETVGRPMPGMEIRIVDEQRQPLPPGQAGELACRSDSIMLGYYRAPELTAEVMDEDGWYYTGDLAVIDEAGYVHIVGRKKDVIIRGGQNIYPAEIEAYLTSHPKVREAAVVGVPSVVGGESVWAFVIPEGGAEMTAQEVLDYCRVALEPYKIPGRVQFVTDFPRSETGKPLKFRLREMALHETKGGELP